MTFLAHSNGAFYYNSKSSKMPPLDAALEVKIYSDINSELSATVPFKKSHVGLF